MHRFRGCGAADSSYALSPGPQTRFRSFEEICPLFPDPQPYTLTCRFRSCEEIEGSRRVEDGSEVVLQVDADQDCLRLFQGASQVASIAVPFPKPWQPALLLMHDQSVVRLEGEVRDAGKLSVDGVIEERVGPDWSARSVRTGSVYGVVQVLRLMQSVLLGSFELGDLEDMLASYRYGGERVMHCIQSRLNGTSPQIEGGEW